MEEIIGGTRSDEGVIGEESSTNTRFKLPKLRNLELRWTKLICDSLKVIEVRNCEKLKRMEICLPLLENGQPSPPRSLREIYIEPECLATLLTEQMFIALELMLWKLPVVRATQTTGQWRSLFTFLTE
jgi:hypothetical protein